METMELRSICILWEDVDGFTMVEYLPFDQAIDRITALICQGIKVEAEFEDQSYSETEEY